MIPSLAGRQAPHIQRLMQSLKGEKFMATQKGESRFEIALYAPSIAEAKRDHVPYFEAVVLEDVLADGVVLKLDDGSGAHKVIGFDRIAYLELDAELIARSMQEAKPSQSVGFGMNR